ncbi:DUF305 domain-containing protein [Nocardia rhizosphaerihabitans]|uniref:DUF305 domain-containing protein n=1 Tax=Nocardia rhizosphaerihabitans TaxID=1691570 RepID=A0ABQ2KNB1_9NOCA|nr:DUF305 domain-containing protein [Nocardia rhizosphaerihabitans]GGN87350.1 DUF305 domain-containing protein [Nocardia rhizosphaerihabitans]
MGTDTAVDPDDNTDDTAAEPGPRRPAGAILVLGAIGLLLLGAVAGVLLRLPLDKTETPAPGPVDVGFSQDMSAHHAQAVDMAGAALIGSTDNDVRRLAYDILTTQQNQIGRMQGWLQLWGEPNQNVDGYMGWMTDHGSGSHGHGGTTTGHEMSGPMTSMPGMASQEEMTALRQSTGPAMDTLFLQLMLRHHQGGVPMLDYAAEHADTTEVRVLAAQMSKTQEGESQLMTSMLAARGASPLPLS